jgi:hypothetical protein
MTARLTAAVIFAVSAALAACGGEGGAADDTTSPEGSAHEGSATASWDGEELAFEGAYCRLIDDGMNFAVNAYSDENSIEVHFGNSGVDQEHDYTEGNIILSLQDENQMIVRRFTARPGTVEFDSTGEDHARGRAEMDPSNDSARMANPDGGRLEFDIRC